MAEAQVFPNMPPLDDFAQSASGPSSEYSHVMDSKCPLRLASDAVPCVQDPGSSSSSVRTSSRGTPAGSCTALPAFSDAATEISPSAISSTPKLSINQTKSILRDTAELNQRIQRLMRTYYMTNYQLHSVALPNLYLPPPTTTTTRRQRLLAHLKRPRNSALNSKEDDAFWVTIHRLLVAEEAATPTPTAARHTACDALCLPGPTSWALRTACAHRSAFWYAHVRNAARTAAESSMRATAARLQGLDAGPASSSSSSSSSSSVVVALVRAGRWAELARRVRVDVGQLDKYFPATDEDGRRVRAAMEALAEMVRCAAARDARAGRAVEVEGREVAPGDLAIRLEYAYLQRKRLQAALSSGVVAV